MQMPARGRFNRFQAAATHFGISVLVVGTVFLVVYLLWYPAPLFRGAGGRDLFTILAFVDVTIGPLITLIIFVPGKRGLEFDLVTIAVMQVSALAYGAYVVFEARPVWLVFIKDRFDLVRANQIEDEDLARARPEFRRFSITGPRVVAARVPTDPNERFRMTVSGLAGKDVSSYPQHYVPYDEARSEAAKAAKPLKDLRRYNAAELPQVERSIAALGRPEKDLGYLPLRSGRFDLSAIVDVGNGELVSILDFRPWQWSD